MFWWVDPVQSALMPHDAAAALVVCHSFLLAEPFAVYGSGACFDLKLFVFGFMHGFASRACDHSGKVEWCPGDIEINFAAISAPLGDCSLPSHRRASSRQPIGKTYHSVNLV